MSDETRSEAIEDAITDPAAASQDGRSATARPIRDLIEADQYLSGKEALSNGQSGWAALRPARVVPPGASE